jgi:hypothetical protein
MKTVLPEKRVRSRVDAVLNREFRITKEELNLKPHKLSAYGLNHF